MVTLTVFEEFSKPWIYAVLFKTVMTSTLTGLSGKTHLLAQSPIFIPTKKIKGKTSRLGSRVKSSTLCGKRRLLAKSQRNLLLTINNRGIANCVQRPRLLYVRAVRFTSARSTQISPGSLNAFGLFLSSRIECVPSLKRWALAMIISRTLKHPRLNRSPSCLALTLCRSSLPPHRSALYQHLSRPHIPH